MSLTQFSFSFLTVLLCATAQDREVLRLAPSNSQAVAEDADGTTFSLPALTDDHVVVRGDAAEWTIQIRVSSPGAQGLQLLFEDLHLPEGARLSISCFEGAGTSRRIATYEGAGPLGGDSFWSTAAPGAELLVEVRFAGGALSTLPFRLTQVRALNEHGLLRTNAASGEEPLLHPELEGRRGLAAFRGQVVPFEIKDGMAMFEKDIILSPAAEVDVVSTKAAQQPRQSQGITNTYYRWTGGIVPYEIDPAVPSQNRITDAIAHWNTKLSGVINLRPRNGEPYFVRFTNSATAGTCSSYIGNVHMAGQAITLGSYCSTGNVIHEIGHAVGLYHEHTREDRNSFVRVNTANVTSSALGNFNQAITASDDLGAYDYGSIMHYGAYAFSANGLPTIETMPAGIPIGQRSTLSANDIAGVNLMYPAIATPTKVTVTVNSNPSGRVILVDGTAVSAPASFLWTPGTAHSVAAQSETSGSTRYVFRNWSDGGAQNHVITVSATASTVTANFQRQFQILPASSDIALGTVEIVPASADFFYNDSASVSLVATPSTSACLAGWAGLIAPPTSPILLTVNQPYAVTGNFLSGTQLLSPSVVNATSAAMTAKISVMSPAGCGWTAKSNASWISITSGGTGTTNGLVTLSIAKRPGNKARTGTVTIGGATLRVNQ